MNLAEALPMEQERVRNLLPMYDAIPTGKFAAHMMRQALAKAEKAATHTSIIPPKVRLAN
jgi:hypothetical protein